MYYLQNKAEIMPKNLADTELFKTLHLEECDLEDYKKLGFATQKYSVLLDYERNGYVLSEKFLDREYRFVRPVFDVKKKKYNICWADFVLLLEDAVVTKVYLTEVA